MATSEDLWTTVDENIDSTDISFHAIFNQFRSNNLQPNTITRNLMTVKNDLLYLYSISTGWILVTRALSLERMNDSQRYQIYKPNVRPQGEVTALRISEDGGKAALISTAGIYVLTIDHVHTCCMLPEHIGNESDCSSWLISPNDQRMHSGFVYEVMQARWHPEQLGWLVALFNDNCLRLYSAAERRLVNLVSIGPLPAGRLSTVIPLGEHAIDFDFAPTQSLWDDECKDPELSQHPIVLLRANGEVFTAFITEDNSKTLEPFRVLPWTVKEHSLSFCSLAVLPSILPVVIYANSNTIYHCFLFPKATSTKELVLQVFEKVDINLGEELTREYDTPKKFTLVKEDSNRYWYFVLHDSGVHVTMLPIMPTLERFLPVDVGEGSDTKFSGKEIMKKALLKYKSQVYQLVCTNIEGRGPSPAYLFGMAVIPGYARAPARFLTLTSRAVVHVLKLQPITLRPIHTASKETFEPALAVDSSPEGKKSFLQVISKYLVNPGSDMPVLSLENSTDSKDCLQILRQYLTNIKEEKIRKQPLVMEILQLKTVHVRNKYQQQLQDFQALKLEREKQKINAEKIAEKYEETNDRQQEISKRFEAICLVLHQAVESLAEKRMRGELMDIKKKMGALKISLDQAKAKHMYLETEEPDERNSGVEQKPLYLSESHKLSLYASLDAMTKKIRDIKNRMENLKIAISALKED